MMKTFWMFGLFALAFGGIVGSFLNVVIHRVPAGESIVSPPSRCPECESRIHWYDNIPVLSWIVLGGRCRHCDAPIPLRYTLVEGLTAGLAFAIWCRTAHPVFADATPLEPPSVAAVALPFFLYFAFVALLIAIAFIDLEHYIVPHVLTVPGMILGLATPWIFKLTFDYQFIARLWPPVTPWESILGWLGGGLTVVAIFYLYLAVRGIEGLGGGDVTLMATIGAWLGWPALLFVFFASSLQGTLAAALTHLVGERWAKPLSEILDRTSPDVEETSAGASGPTDTVHIPLETPPDPTSSETISGDSLRSPEEVGTLERKPADEAGASDRLAVPFGPFLALAAVEHLMLGDYLPAPISMSYLYDLYGFGGF